MANNLQDLWGGAKSDYTINGPLAGVLAGQVSEMQRSQMQDQTLQEAIASRQKQAEYDRYNQMTPGTVAEQNGKAGFEGARGDLAKAGLKGNIEAQARQQKIEKYHDAFAAVAPFYSDDSTLSFDNFQQYLDPETAAIVGPQVKNFAKAHNLPEQAAFKTMFKSLTEQRDTSNTAYRAAVAGHQIQSEGGIRREEIQQAGATTRNDADIKAGKYNYRGAPAKSEVDKLNSLPPLNQYQIIGAALDSHIDPVTKEEMTPEREAYYAARFDGLAAGLSLKSPTAKPGTIDMKEEAGINVNPNVRLPTWAERKASKAVQGKRPPLNSFEKPN